MTSKEITLLLNEILQGDVKNLQKLKWLLNEFFKGKTQQELEQLGGNNLYAFSRIQERLKDKKDISELDKAYIEEYLNINSKRYVYLNSSGVANKEKLLLVLKEIKESNFFDEKESLEVESIFNYTLESDSWVEDVKIADKNKEFEILILFTHYEEQPEISINIRGVKEKESFYRKIIKIISEE